MVNNEFGKLKSCVVGTAFNFSKRNIDFTLNIQGDFLAII